MLLSNLVLVGSGVLFLLATILLALALLPPPLVEPSLTGYRRTERDEAFERAPLLRALWPAVRLGAWYGSWFPLANWRKQRRELLRLAGEPLGLDDAEYLGLLIAALVGTLLVSPLLVYGLEFGWSIVLIAPVCVYFLPDIWLERRKEARRRAIERMLPAALDLIVLCMGAGLDFLHAVKEVIAGSSDAGHVLYQELKRLVGEMEVMGVPRATALENLGHRVPWEPMRSLIQSAIQAETSGTPLVEVLRTQSDVVRVRRLQRAESEAGRAAVLITLPALLIFIATMLLMFGGMWLKTRNEGLL